MTNCGLWVNHKWVKSPLTPLTRTPVGWGASGTFLNGGAYALASKTRHYEISAQWMGTQAEIASIIDEIDTGEPIYLTDPFSYANILPHWLAKPQAMTKDAPYFTAVRPILSGGDAVFTGTGTKTFTVSVPEGGGRFVWYGFGSGVTVNGVSRTVGTVVSVPAGLCTIGMTGTGSRTVSGMVLSAGQEPVQGTPGQGYTQVQCTSVSVTGYSAPSAIDRVGLSATFIEVGGWR